MHTRNITTQQLEELRRLLDETAERVPYKLANRTHTSDEILKFTDGEESLTYKSMIDSYTVSQDSPKKVDGDIIVSDKQNNTAWFLSTQQAEDIEFFPEIRQAHHKNDFKELFTGVEIEYYFSNGEVLPAKKSIEPVKRLDEPIVISEYEQINTGVINKWLLLSEEDDIFYLRERSGSINLYRGVERCRKNNVFKAFIGGEHPGTHLRPKEILNIVSSVDYINIKGSSEEVPKWVKDKYWDERHYDIQDITGSIEDFDMD